MAGGLRTPPLALIIGVGIFGARYFGFSAVSIILVLFLLFLLSSRRQAGGAEPFTPIFDSSVVAGLRAGVASIQGRRQYMEDMHQAVAFDPHDQPAAARVGLTHFFAVYDGHGGKRAAAWAHKHLVSNLLRVLERGSKAHGRLAEGASADECADVLDAAAVDAFHRTDAGGSHRHAARVARPRAHAPPSRRAPSVPLADERARPARQTFWSTPSPTASPTAPPPSPA